MVTPFAPVDCWKLRTRTLVVGKIPLLMGIVNVTPDSFSDGGKFFDPTKAVEHGLQLAADGADLLDIGGESTRPGAKGVPAEEELRRVLPVIKSLSQQVSLPISVDTCKAAVAAQAIAAGAEVINDVTALVGDPAMAPLAAKSGCGVCVMHMQGNPTSMQHNPIYKEVLEEIFEFLRVRRNALISAGVEQARIALDPGIGFGKTPEHNVSLLAGIGRFHALKCPILVGPSRKRFIGHVLGDMEADRTAGTLGTAMAMARQGVQILRVHDVKTVRQALLLFQASGGR